MWIQHAVNSRAAGVAALTHIQSMHGPLGLLINIMGEGEGVAAIECLRGQFLRVAGGLFLRL